MNAGEEYDDEMLMAYADGELPEAERAAIARAAAADPTVAARIASFTRSRAAVKEAFAALHAEPAPARLTAAALAGGERIVSLAPRRPALRARFTLPLAAAIAIGAGLVGFLAGRVTEPSAGAGLEAYDGAFAALTQTRSGVTLPVTIDGRDARATAIVSFEAGGSYCRVALFAFDEGSAQRGVGCREESGWRATLVVAEGASGAFGPASAAGIEIVEATLDALEAGAALDPDAEARAIAGGWR
ncbi:MAG: hypothetical protein MEP57_07985 [Microvirga sp.]|nr:hypothetical protein [Microvirga sp.]